VDGDAAVSDFELYRYTHSDGTAKEWAWCIQAGGIEVRWGRAGRLVQQARYPLSRRTEIEERSRAKERKGYRYVGRFGIDADGRPVVVIAPPSRTNPTIPRPSSQSSLPPIDLSQVDTGREDYWF
jgi:hypothetical protein